MAVIGVVVRDQISNRMGAVNSAQSVEQVRT